MASGEVPPPWPWPGLPLAAYLGTERAGLWGEAIAVLLGHLFHQPLHLLPLDLLFPLLEGRLACDHLI